MTSDEMFQKIGYTHCQEWHGIKQFFSADKTEIIQVSKGGIRKFASCGCPMPLYPNEIRAISKLLDEMRVE